MTDTNILTREECRTGLVVAFEDPHDEYGKPVESAISRTGSIDTIHRDSIGVWVRDRRFQPAGGYLVGIQFDQFESFKLQSCGRTNRQS